MISKHCGLIKRLREHNDERLYEAADLLMSEAADALQAAIEEFKKQEIFDEGFKRGYVEGYEKSLLQQCIDSGQVTAEQIELHRQNKELDK